MFKMEEITWSGSNPEDITAVINTAVQQAANDGRVGVFIKSGPREWLVLHDEFVQRFDRKDEIVVSGERLNKFWGSCTVRPSQAGRGVVDLGHFLTKGEKLSHARLRPVSDRGEAIAQLRDAVAYQRALGVVVTPVDVAANPEEKLLSRDFCNILRDPDAKIATVTLDEADGILHAVSCTPGGKRHATHSMSMRYYKSEIERNRIILGRCLNWLRDLAAAARDTTVVVHGDVDLGDIHDWRANDELFNAASEFKNVTATTVAAEAVGKQDQEDLVALRKLIADECADCGGRESLIDYTRYVTDGFSHLMGEGATKTNRRIVARALAENGWTHDGETWFAPSK